MKKGFTLVELLGVIVVLAIVMGLAVVSVSSIIDKGRIGVYEDYIDTLETAAKTYFIDDNVGTNHDPNKVSFPRIGQTVTLTYNNIKGNDSSFKSLSDPNGGNCDASYIKVTRNADIGINYNLTYKVCLKCTHYTSSGCN